MKKSILIGIVFVLMASSVVFSTEKKTDSTLKIELRKNYDEFQVGEIKLRLAIFKYERKAKRELKDDKEELDYQLAKLKLEYRLELKMLAMKHMAIEDNINARYALVTYAGYRVAKRDKELLLAAKEIGVIEGKILGALDSQSVFSSHPNSDGYKLFQLKVDKLREDAYKILRKYPSLKFLALHKSETIPQTVKISSL